MRNLLAVILFASALFAQTTNYPGNVDTDSTLYITADNIQTSLASAMLAGDNVAIVKSGTGFLANMVATICDSTAVVVTGTTKCSAWEHMLVTNVNGNVLTVTRGILGTSAVGHAVGKVVSVAVDSGHQKSLKAAVIAIESALGANLGNVQTCIPVTGTIQQAHDALPSSGGCLYLPAATYTFASLTITKSVRFVGAGDATIVKLASSTNTAGAVITAATAGTTVVFQSLKFDGNRANNSTTASAFLYCQSARCIVDSSTFVNINANAAIKYQDSVRSLVAHSHFENNLVHGVSLSQTVSAATQHVVIGNTFLFSSYTISGCTNTTPVTCTSTAANGFIANQNVTISGASVAALNNQWNVTPTGATTFQLQTSTASGVSTGGTVYEGNFSLATFNQQNISVIGNTVEAGGEGLQFYGVIGSTIAGNTVHFPRDAGITLTGDGGSGFTDGNSITGNTVIGAFFEGLYCGLKCTNNTFSGNTVKSSGISGIAARMSGMQIFGASTTGNLIVGNRFAGNPEYGINVRAGADQTRMVANDAENNSLGEFTTDGTDTGTSYVSPKGSTRLFFSCAGVATSSATLLMSVTPPGNCTNATEGNAQFILNNKPGLLRNLLVRFGSNAVNNTAVTIRLNAATNTTLTCTVLAGAATCSDIVHSVATIAGDVITAKVVTGGAETLSGIQISLDN